MGNSLYVLVLLMAGLVAANLPFVTRRLFGLFGPDNKTLGMRLLELVLFYFLVGGIGLLLEKNVGQIAPQGWEFYAITATLFLTFAFPGFVYRYLLKHHD
ncbi:Uncharacterised conserved protein UCP019883, membrane [Comamonadaceae bacterium]